MFGCLPLWKWKEEFMPKVLFERNKNQENRIFLNVNNNINDIISTEHNDFQESRLGIYPGNKNIYIYQISYLEPLSHKSIPEELCTLKDKYLLVTTIEMFFNSVFHSEQMCQTSTFLFN